MLQHSANRPGCGDRFAEDRSLIALQQWRRDGVECPLRLGCEVDMRLASEEPWGNDRAAPRDRLHRLDDLAERLAQLARPHP